MIIHDIIYIYEIQSPNLTKTILKASCKVPVQNASGELLGTSRSKVEQHCPLELEVSGSHNPCHRRG